MQIQVASQESHNRRHQTPLEKSLATIRKKKVT